MITGASVFLEDIIFLLSVFVGSSVGGWAKMLHLGKPIPRGKKIGGVILSGIAGVITACLLWNYMSDAPFLLWGTSTLSGIGGASTIDWLTGLIKKRVEK